MVKLICTDIDGTLLNRQREIDVYTKKVFHRLIGKVQIVLASSRMPKALWHIQKELNIEDMPLICYNGALMLSDGKIFNEGKIINSTTIPEEIIHSVVALAEQHQVHVSIYHNNTWIASSMDFWTEREINNTRVKPDLILTALSERAGKKHVTHTAHKIMIMGERNKVSLIEEMLTAKSAVSLCRSKDTYLEITPIDTDKSIGLSILLKHISKFNDITLDDIMAFGDNHNDYKLLRDVKYGIVVENGIQQLKDIAYEVTKANYDSGVACYLEKAFFSDSCQNSKT